LLHSTHSLHISICKSVVFGTLPTYSNMSRTASN
jgi:hypothetical protein